MPQAASGNGHQRARARSAGRCVVLVGPEGRGKDLLIAAARRRFSADASLAFPERVTTRPAGALGSEQAVTRRAFQELQAGGELLVDWESGGRSFGVSRACAGALAAGATVVLAGTAEAVEKFRTLGYDVRPVEVGAGADGVRARAGSAAAAAAARLAGAKRTAAPIASALCHTGDLADAVRRFHEYLLTLRIETLGEVSPRALVKGRRAAPLRARAKPSPARPR